jgi:prevent-host-death family protein
MSRKEVGIETARKTLGDLVTQVQQGADIILTRNGKPAVRLVNYVEEMVTITELAQRVGMDRAPEKVARWALCFTPYDSRTGALPKPWQGQGMDAMFTQAQADQLEANWYSDVTHAEGMEGALPGDADATEIADRYRP